MSAQGSLNGDSDRRVRLLQDLVEVPSGTQTFSGVNQVQDLVAEELRKLGFDITFLPNPEGAEKSGKFLIASLNSSQQTSGGFIDLLAHADTVFEKDSNFLKFELNSSQGTAKGPGVIDDKGGIVVALAGLEKFLKKIGKKNFNQLPIRFICSPSEEIGSPGFTSLFQKLSSESKIVLGFEPSLEDGSIIESRRGNRWFDIQVSGKEGHAGRDSENCVNAAHELAFKLTHLHGLTDRKRNITVSTGQIGGGSKYNIVCGHAHAKVDVRFSDFESREAVHRQIETILNTAYLGTNAQGEIPKTSYTIANDCPPFAKTDLSTLYVKKYLEIIAEIEGISVKSTQSGGAADANYMSRPGLVILDGLGPQGGGIHRKDEFIRLASLESRSEALVKFLEFAIHAPSLNLAGTL